MRIFTLFMPVIAVLAVARVSSDTVFAKIDKTAYQAPLPESQAIIDAFIRRKEEPAAAKRKQKLNSNAARRKLRASHRGHQS